MDAITIGDEDVSEVDENICLGCGVCVATCPTEAIALEQRAEIKPPPRVEEFLAKRRKKG